ncbi:MAG: trimethylamine methyltransferase family protein [Deltaproteobacteria bacterium]|nr:trimethylamine methyltransferase family protein [Deltaproteobacteria bacterium]
MLKNNKGGISELRILSKDGMQQIHENALRVLQETGIRVDSDTALKMLADAGADVDFKTGTVKIPPSLVEECLPKVSRKITMAGRNPNRDLLFEPDGKMYTRNSGGQTQIHDIDTDEIRDTLVADLDNHARLMDALDYIDFVAPVYPSDLPTETLELHVLEHMFHNTDKHINMRALDRRNFPYLIKMAEAVAGGKEALKKRPVISILEAPISPLQFPEVFIDSLFLGGEYGIPIEICSMPSVGATGPITLAGSLLLSAAEHLATIVISQLAHPGAPLIWASRFTIMDMSTGVSGMFVEAALVNAAAAQLAKEQYNMVCDLHGPGTNAVLPDGQSVLEECLGAFVTGFAGRPTALAGAGSLNIGLIISFVEMVITNEIFSAGHRIIEGFEVNDETLALDAIKRVGIGGNFLMDDHTLKHVRDEDHRSLFVRPQTKDSWIAGGSKGMNDIAKEKALEILATHRPAPLDEGVAEKLQQIIREAEKAFGVV